MVIEMGIVVEGAEEFKAAMQNFNANLQKSMQERLESWTEEVKESAKQLAPKRTGQLQGSIYARKSEWMVEIGAEAAYAASVELGTRHMHARPYILPALQQHLPLLERALCDALDEAKSEAGLT